MDNIDYAGIDVSNKTLEVALTRKGKLVRKEFANTPAGHRKLKKFLEMKTDRFVRAVFESTGVYGLDMAILLSDSRNVQICEANPRAVRRFAEASMRRGKTDTMDAMVLSEYAKKMEFRPYNPPSEEARSLRCIARRIHALSEMKVEERNRLHAAERTKTTPEAILRSLKKSIEQIEQSICELKAAAMEIISSSDELLRMFELIISISGIAETSGTLILGEIACMPADIDARQLVAMAGLDPVEYKSGTSVNVIKGISKQGNKYLRTALHMPAMVAHQHDPHIKAYFDHLVGMGKKKPVANTAVMRKLLHAIWGMLKNDQPFDGSKFYKMPEPPAA